MGYDVTVEELLRKYHVVVLAYGAGSGEESVYVDLCKSSISFLAVMILSPTVFNITFGKI